MLRKKPDGIDSATHEELIKIIKNHIAEASQVGAEVVRPYIAQTARAASVQDWADKIVGVIKEVLPLLRKYGLKWGTK